ncbi:MAG: TIR domain-containing protein [Chloroflexi bacterium]|nr:TIR domain-containing protein [Chloroflexota bacterium]
MSTAPSSPSLSTSFFTSGRDVFISYSSQDTAFVAKLRQSIELTGRTVWQDIKELELTAEWWAQIKAGIFSADNFLMVVSPRSMASPICHLELEYARALHKRVIFIRYEDAEKQTSTRAMVDRILTQDYLQLLTQGRDMFGVANATWAAFDAEQNIAIRSSDELLDQVPRLVEAFDKDLHYVRQHNLLLGRAHEWLSSGRNVGFLLRGEALTSAEVWLAAGKKPVPTSQHVEYIDASRAEEDRQSAESQRRETLVRRQQTGANILVGLLILSAIFTLVVYGISRNALNDVGNAGSTLVAINATLTPILPTLTAVNAQVAAAAESLAAAQAEGTQVALDAAVSRATFLADLSRRELTADGDVRVALLLAEEALDTYPQREFVVGHQALADAAYAPGLERLRLVHNGAVNGARLLSNARVLTWSDDGGARVWDGETGKELLALRHEGEVRGAEMLRDGRVLTWSWDGTARLWNGETGEGLLVLRHEGEVRGAEMLRDGRVLTWSQDGTARAWDGETGEELLLLHHDGAVKGAEVLSDGRILTWSWDGVARVWNGETGDELLSLGHQDVVWGAKMLSDGRILTWSDDGTVRAWNEETGEELMVLRLGSWVNGAEMLSDGRILTWSGDGMGRVWDGETGEELLVLRHQGVVWGAETLSDGRILTWSEDGAARVWDGETGEELLVLHHEGGVYDAEDCRMVVSGGAIAGPAP